MNLELGVMTGENIHERLCSAEIGGDGCDPARRPSSGVPHSKGGWRGNRKSLRNRMTNVHGSGNNDIDASYPLLTANTRSEPQRAAGKDIDTSSSQEGRRKAI
ncbi:MAG: hypothetical protein ACP5LD_09030 [Desulfomonilaceae bacterium]